MKTIKIIFCIAIWLVLGWLCLSKISQGIHDEIVNTLTSRNGFQPTEHQIVTYYYERYQK